MKKFHFTVETIYVFLTTFVMGWFLDFGTSFIILASLYLIILIISHGFAERLDVATASFLVAIASEVYKKNQIQLTKSIIVLILGLTIIEVTISLLPSNSTSSIKSTTANSATNRSYIPKPLDPREASSVISPVLAGLLVWYLIHNFGCPSFVGATFSEFMLSDPIESFPVCDAKFFALVSPWNDIPPYYSSFVVLLMLWLAFIANFHALNILFDFKFSDILYLIFFTPISAILIFIYALISVIAVSPLLIIIDIVRYSFKATEFYPLVALIKNLIDFSTFLVGALIGVMKCTEIIVETKYTDHR